MPSEPKIFLLGYLKHVIPVNDQETVFKTRLTAAKIAAKKCGQKPFLLLYLNGLIRFGL